MTLPERLAAHEAAKCPECDGQGCGFCGFDGLGIIEGIGYREGYDPPTHAEHAALLRFAVAVEAALDAKVADGMCVLRVNDARNAVKSELAALEGEVG